MSGLGFLAEPVHASLLSLVLSVLVTGFMLRYARRRGLLDAPGQRRSHTVPTPRGGGVGLVIGALAGMGAALATSFQGRVFVAFMTAALLVAAVGWWDDHRALPAWPRLLVHLAASALFTTIVLVDAHPFMWWTWPALVLIATWSINLHNFMDGIDGLLGMQLVFIGVAMAALLPDSAAPGLVSAWLALAAASVGFLLYNRPPARIFMGDVGSGCAGLLVFMLSGLWCLRDPRAIWVIVILNAVFVCDAGWTLLWRIVRGRRWYTAHREHLYQWLVRCGFSHGQTGCLYFALNLMLCAPAAWLARDHARLAPWLCVGVYALASAGWWIARRACLERVPYRRRRNAHA